MASSDCPASEMVVAESSSVDVKLLLSHGQQSVKAGNVSAAIESFKEACSALEKQFGEGAAELADAYLLYGQALLLKSGDHSAIPETKDGTAAAPGKDALGAGDTVNEGGKESTVDASTMADAGDMASGDSDSVHSLQVAEKVLGYARDTFSGSEELEAKIKHCQALLGLGKSCLHRKNYDQGVAYLNKSLDVQKMLSLGDTKTLVETYYFLGVCYSVLKRPDNSLTDLNLGMTVANSILSAEVTVNGAEGEVATKQCDDLAAVTVLLQNIISKIESVRAESAIIADADSTAVKAGAESETAVGEQVKTTEPVTQATEPVTQATELGDSVFMEVTGCQAAAEVAVPSDQNPDPLAEAVCSAEQGNADSVVPSDSTAESDVPNIDPVSSNVPSDGVTVADKPTDGVAESDVPDNGVAASDVPVNGVAASDVHVNGVAASDVHVNEVALSELPVNGAVASDVPVGGEVVSDVPTDSAVSADVLVDGVDSSDGSTVASNITNVCNKRVLEEESHEVVKKAKHDIEASENGGNNVDVSAPVNSADGCHEDM